MRQVATYESVKREVATRGPDMPLVEGCCAWVANGMQCRFPGTTTQSTLGTDRWYCRFHFNRSGTPIDLAVAAEVVVYSQGYTPDRYDEMYRPKVRDNDEPR